MSINSGFNVHFVPPDVAPINDVEKFHAFDVNVNPLWMVPAPNKMLLGVFAVTPVFFNSSYGICQFTFHSFMSKLIWILFNSGTCDGIVIA